MKSMLCISLLLLIAGSMASHAGDSAAPAVPKPIRVAVLHFNDTTLWGYDESAWRNTQGQHYAPQALATMLSSDLASMQDVELIEQEEVSALYQEAKIGEVGLANEETAQSLGKALSADVIISGSLRRDAAFVRLVPRIWMASTGRKERLKSLEGRLDQLIDLEQSLVKEYVEHLKLQPRQVKAVSAPQENALPLTMAVVDFRNDGPPADNKEIGGALADMLTARLSEGAQRFKLVDRNHVSAVLLERKLDLGRLIQRGGSGDLGKWMGAQVIAQGSYMLAGGSIRLVVRLIHPESARTLAICSATGMHKEIGSVAQDLAKKLTNAPIPVPLPKASPVLPVAGSAKPGTEVSSEDKYKQIVREYNEWIKSVYGGQPWLPLANWENRSAEMSVAIRKTGEDLVRRIKAVVFEQPRNGAYHAMLGKACIELGIFEEGRQELEEGLRLKGDPELCLCRIAESLMTEKKYADARNTWKRLIQTAPDWSAYAHHGIAWAWEAEGDYVRKREELAQVIASDPQFAQGQYERAMQIWGTMGYGDALMQDTCTVNNRFIRVLDLNPNDLRAFYNVAHSWYRRNGDLDTHVQWKLLAERLKEHVDRTGNTYLYFSVIRYVIEFNPNTPDGFKSTRPVEPDDSEWLDSYESGMDKEYSLAKGESRVVTGGGHLIYKLKFPGTHRIEVNVDYPCESDIVIKASKDKAVWTEVQRHVHSDNPKLEWGILLELNFHPIDLTKYAAADGTVFLRIEDATPEGKDQAEVKGLCAIGIKSP